MGGLFLSWLMMIAFFYADFMAVLIGSRPAG